MQTLLEQIELQSQALSFSIVHNPEVELMVCCAHTHLDEASTQRIQVLLQQPINWQRFVQLCQLHAVLPLIYTHLHNRFAEAVPPEVLVSLRLLFHQRLFHNLRLSRELVNLLTLFKAHGISAIPFKGAVLATSAYGNLSLRMFADLDILISPSDAVKARDLLQSQGYFARQSPWLFTSEQDDLAQLKSQGECTFVHPNSEIGIDLHTRLIAGTLFDLSSGFESFCDRVQPVTIANHTTHSFCPEDLLIFLCVHGTKELWARLGWICDVAEVLRSSPDLDWDVVWREAHRLRVEKMLLLGLLLVQRVLSVETSTWIQIEVTPEIQQLAEQVYRRIYDQPERLPKGLTWERFRFHWTAMSGLRDRLRYSLQGAIAVTIVPLFNLFRPSYRDHNFFPLPQAFYFCYFFVRPIRLISVLEERLLSKIIKLAVFWKTLS